MAQDVRLERLRHFPKVECYLYTTSCIYISFAIRLSRPIGPEPFQYLNSSFRVVTALLPSPSIFIPRIDVLILSPLLDEVMFLLCCVVIWLAQILEYDHNGTQYESRTRDAGMKILSLNRLTN